jgi:hypothetical protein
VHEIIAANLGRSTSRSSPIVSAPVIGAAASITH